jgi:hypothetical protein
MDLRIHACWLSLYWFVSSPLLIFAQPTFTLNGSASMLSENCYRLTSANYSNDVGSIWGDYTVDFRNTLEFHFAVNFGCSKSVGEGLAFVLHTHQNGVASLGCGGGAMGFARKDGCNNAIFPSLAIEFDTRYTVGDKDLFRPHIALIQDGNLAAPLVAAVPMLEGGKTPLDCEYHDIRITWSPSKQELCVFIDGNLRLSHIADLNQNIFGNNPEIHFGFTASTSQQPAAQMLCMQNVIEELDETYRRKQSFEESVGIYTNPIREKLTIDIRLQGDEYLQMQLFDASGKIIYDIPAHLVRQNQYHFNLPGLPSGVYYVTITNGTDRVSKRIVHIATMRA